ncbi:MAG: glutamine synthetase III [Bacteroidetes bacterium]|nr:glutamine synthetase III [Bacteroidota bacterium]
MTTYRKEALRKALNRDTIFQAENPIKISEIFGMNVFGRDAMREYLPEDVFESIMHTINEGTTIDRKIASQVASAMKNWAMNKGATHYTHWFHPLNGATAEKHDAFFTPTDNLRSISKFEGNQLIQQETDGSSFPSGGIRNTFEARGYTAWDPTSPAFVYNGTLCIPTIFISYTVESLDYKTPLLRAVNAIDKAAVDICQYFDKNVTKVIPTLGWEQEYFLVDEALYFARPDLVLTGRTLFGHASAKDQQMEDHYFGSIPERVTNYMKEFEIEALKLGIPVKTRHNEVAPNQFELAPVYEEANLAIDHNQLLMDLMERIAHKHHFRVLFHEKPFAGINGSGKHNNWSLATNKGKNLLSPGKTPKTNLQFLTFFINIIKAVHDHSSLLRAAIASASNDHRLGAHEAPPAIISVFIGVQLTKIFEEIVQKVKTEKMSPDEKTDLKLNIGKIPQIIFDNTDRNRTSPFAFTGDKFELRPVGSSANCSPSMIVLNTIVANQLIAFKKDVDKLINESVEKDEAIFRVLRNYIIHSKNVLFEGNGYSEEWAKEAKKRGLSNVRDTPLALDAYLTDKTKKLFKLTNVLSERELEARYFIKQECYTKTLQIEARVIGDLALNHVIPTALKYQNLLLQNVSGLKDILLEKDFKKQSGYQIELITEISEHIKVISVNVHNLIEARKKANLIEDTKAKSIEYCEKVKPFFETIRYHVDKLEILVDDELWPLPKYRELLFVR